ncbi:hypothetical protein BGX38DRAFT_1169691 [Terfezia claveryi]|nr:hypothetical protein BGX38DRAFT_1169691 [Terfezia claveryi]
MFANSMPVRTTFCLLFLLSSLARTLAVPAPTNTYDKVEMGNYQELPLCSSDGICLSPPPMDSRLVAVVLGVGTQNYTCTSPTQAPTSNVAIATLYDITKLVGLAPGAAHASSAIVMALSTAQNTQNIPPGLGYPEIGEHHFEPRYGKGAVAVFNVWVKGKQRKFVGGKLEGILPAPNSFPGSVDWLKLGRTAGSEKESRGIKFVYRVHTAGGKAPATCEGLQYEHTVKYATEYCEF